MRNQRIIKGFILLALLVFCTAQIYSQSSSIERTKDSGLCARLALIKELPYSYEEMGVDSNYDALYQAGEAVIPCLIDKITDTTVMADPRCPRISEDTKVGDVAYFVLVGITKIKFEEMLPASVQKKYLAEGVYAYHSYIDGDGARAELQSKLRDRYKQKLKSDSFSRVNKLKNQGNEIIVRIENFRNSNDRVPRSLAEIGIEEKLEGPIYYEKKGGSQYILWFGMELGESVTYDSNTKQWSR